MHRDIIATIYKECLRRYLYIVSCGTTKPLRRIPASSHKKHKPPALQFSIYQHTICHYANNISRLLCSNGYRHKNVNVVLFASESGNISSQHVIGKLRRRETEESTTTALFHQHRTAQRIYSLRKLTGVANHKRGQTK